MTRLNLRLVLSVAVVLASGCAQIPREPLGAPADDGAGGEHGFGAAACERGDLSGRARRQRAVRGPQAAQRRRHSHHRHQRTGHASKNSGATASRTGSLAADFAGGIPKLLGSLLDGQDAKLSGGNKLDAKGGANANNTFNGVITVTVVDVMRNGNLLVSGEKQMGINQGTEYIRFSGVVNPRTVSGNNTVPSTLVADARIEYTAKGYIDEAQHMGWMQRIFLNVMPF
jgi:flagellar L-ring protein precursor FlgH